MGAFPLHLAAKRGHLAALELLLAGRADVDAADQNGRTGLAVASASGQAAAARRLLERRAAVDAASHYGYSALHYAALLPRPELVELLLAAGASTELTDKQGQTPLHIVLSALPRRAQRQESSCDPSGYGDEYCYCRDTSHGYGGSEGDPEQERGVRRAAEALLLRGASESALDDRGRAAADILEAKCRADLLPWLRGSRQASGQGTPAAPLETAQSKTEQAGWTHSRCPPSCCFSGWRAVLR